MHRVPDEKADTPRSWKLASGGGISAESRISNPDSGHSHSARRVALLLLLAGAVCGLALAADDLSEGLRGTAPLNEEPKAPRMATVENSDIKRGRAYTSQPPTIPHAIERYEITRNVNFCMYCHSRVRNEEFGAPMVSATHFMDRDHDFLAEISPRRYFCTQCHVPQTDAKPPVDNTFIDVYDLIEREQLRSNPRAPAVKKQEE